MTRAFNGKLALAVVAALFAVACSGNDKPKSPAQRGILKERAAESGDDAKVTGAAKAGKSAKSAKSAKNAPVPSQAPAPEPAPVVATEPVPAPAELRELEPDEEVNGNGGAVVGELAPGVVDPSALLHESLDAFESATAFWKQGEIDEALAALDHAYERMSGVEPGGDAVLGQEKENLRHLISKRVVEIYASRKTGTGNLDGAIQRVVNDEVRREIESFQGRERQLFLDGYRRSGTYRPMIVERLRQAGMPDQLSWLPLVESFFKVRALSTARALGMWQFIPSTGYRYGLDRDAWIDERMDPEKSTDGAIGYLTALHDLFGDWLTALAAYNCGEHNVLRAINGQSVSYFDQFWDLYSRLPRETRRYVPRFLATLEIVENPAKYGFELPPLDPPLAYDTVQVARSAQLATLDKALGLAPETLAGLNPELRRKAVPSTAYTLKVPKGTGPTLLASLPAVPSWVPPANETGIHRVRSGETLSSIAARYRTSVSHLMSLNRLRSANRIWPGQQLQVPGGGDGGGTSAAPVVARGGTYVVRPGDTLGSIARRQGVALPRLLAANNLSGGSTIFPGQQLSIPD